MARQKKTDHPISRRKFIQIGGAVTAGSTLSTGLTHKSLFASDKEEQPSIIREYRTLGRTGFKVSDMGMGALRVKEPNVFRYAYDHGVNYFDHAEKYQNGDAERKFGKSVEYMDRKKIFITTKLAISSDESEESIISRFRSCLERMKIDYLDCLYMHGIRKVSYLNKPEFHSAVAKLKAEGRLRFAGLSSHGPRKDDEDSMEKVLTAAAVDGRFDVMLLVYNFMNREAAENILKACKENNVGTTAMKTSPGVLAKENYDPAHPTAEQKKYLDRLQKRYDSQDEIDQKMQGWIQEQQEEYQKTKPFLETYGIKTEDELRINSIRWVRQNADMHTICVSFVDFDMIDKIIPFSGQNLNQQKTGFLDKYKELYNNQYCRHGCNDCMPQCPHKLPVSTIMRYASYYEHQGREKEAILKYARLDEKNGSLCIDCDEPCLSACLYKIDIPTQLLTAHKMLTLA